MTEPRQIPGGWEDCLINIASRSFQIRRPRQSDAFLDQADGDRIPYWAYLWPTAYDVAGWILSNAWQPDGEVLEIGCGIGLCGLAGLAAGWRVTFSDYEPAAVELALTNARRNGFESAAVKQLDWRQPLEEPVSAILGCEVTYDANDHEPLLRFLELGLQTDGVCWMADSDRTISRRFARTAKQRGFRVECTGLAPVSFPQRPQMRSVLWRISPAQVTA